MSSCFLQNNKTILRMTGNTTTYTFLCIWQHTWKKISQTEVDVKRKETYKFGGTIIVLVHIHSHTPMSATLYDFLSIKNERNNKFTYCYEKNIFFSRRPSTLFLYCQGGERVWRGDSFFFNFSQSSFSQNIRHDNRRSCMLGLTTATNYSSQILLWNNLSHSIKMFTEY